MKNNTIFFLTIPLYGHVFPVLDVINKVGKEGYNTYCFVNDFFAEYIKNDTVLSRSRRMNFDDTLCDKYRLPVVLNVFMLRNFYGFVWIAQIV